MGIRKDAIRPPDVVEDHFRLLFQQAGPGILFMLNDLSQNLFKPFDNRGFRLTQGHLIRDLENIAQSLSSLTVKTSDRQAELVDGLDDRIDLFSQNQAWQVEHRAYPDAGADIRGTSCEIAHLGIESVLEFLLESGIRLINR